MQVQNKLYTVCMYIVHRSSVRLVWFHSRHLRLTTTVQRLWSSRKQPTVLKRRKASKLFVAGALSIVQILQLLRLTKSSSHKLLHDCSNWKAIAIKWNSGKAVGRGVRKYVCSNVANKGACAETELSTSANCVCKKLFSNKNIQQLLFVQVRKSYNNYGKFNSVNVHFFFFCEI